MLIFTTLSQRPGFPLCHNFSLRVRQGFDFLLPSSTEIVSEPSTQEHLGRTKESQIKSVAHHLLT